jgi:glutamate synthase domain-containing protein 3
MTGGIGFVMWSDLLPRLINSEWIFLKNIDEEEEFKVLERLLYLHAIQTGSDVPKKIFSEIDMVRVVVPKEFQRYKSNFLKDAILKIERDFADFLPPASK